MVPIATIEELHDTVAQAVCGPLGTCVQNQTVRLVSWTRPTCAILHFCGVAGVGLVQETTVK